ncbi:hypothetical protein XENTR_v10022391 [Xenopus tropicalis]|nr:hypothetical protein XENTR_v10022391 [Xenopus tropicalis]
MNINVTSGNRFILLGLTDTLDLQAVCVLLFLIVYLITWLANSLLIMVVSINAHLQTPMYFFLINLSIIDISMSSSTVPKILQITLAQDKSVSLLECATQMFIVLVLGVTELCICLAAKCWTVGLINAIIQVFLTFQLPFCRSRHINHYFCEVPPILQLSCRDTLFNVIAMYVAACIIVICSFFLILVSYVYIISTILKIRSTEGRYKAFSTCASHLTVVSLYYCTIMSMYLRPRSAYSPETDKTVSLVYTSVTPMLNPIIYSIRNKDIKLTIRKYLTKQKILF